MRHKISKWQVVSFYVVSVGLLVAIYLVHNQSSYQGRANIDVGRSFTLSTDDQGTQPVSCTGTTCITDSDDVYIKFNDGQAQDLLNALP